MLRCTRLIVLVVGLAASMVIAPAMLRGQAVPPAGTAVMQGYAPAEGENYFALSVVPKVAVKQQPCTIAVLFDTSASQVGPYREKGIATLKSLLAQLSPDDRVTLMAVDLKVETLTKSAVPPNSPEIAAALDQLAKREPLGTTDMPLALRSAAEQLGDSAAKAVVYIGDGMSPAHLLASDDFGRLTGELVAKEIPVTSYAVGPQLDNQLLAALANQTGGMLAVDGETLTSEDIAKFLASAARQPVIWPAKVELPEGLTEVYPQPFPPLRPDRDTIVIGVGKLDTPADLKIDAKVAGAQSTLDWKIEPAPPAAENGYLAKLVTSARKDHGVSLPTIGTAGLKEVRRLMDIVVDDLNRLGRQAVATGNLDQAVKLARQSDAIAPRNPDAKAITGAVAQLSGGGDELRINGAAAAEPTPPVEEPDGALLADVERRERIFAEQLDAEARSGLLAARRQMTTDPAGAMESLKVLLEHVREAAEVRPEVRDQLSRQIEVALQQASRQTVIREDETIRLQQIEAVADERRRINEQLFVRDEQLQQLMARFDSLMDEGRFGDASQVAGAARQIGPNVPATTAAVQSGQMAGYSARAVDLRLRRQFGFVDTLATVEAAQIPTPDEPPIYYPDPEVWELLTQRRKQFASVDLQSLKPAEKKIVDELDKPTTLDFVETPLSEVIQYLKDLHKVEIQLDGKALEEAGVATDTPITRNLQGVSLRSALRLMLGELDLTYVIKDEVLLITTVDAAQEQMSTRVYPVADLVVPIMSMGGMGGFGGMMGGMGGGMGGMGMGGMGGGMGGMGMGGMGGMGGGMGGMGMGGGMGGMGMGGGMFNVPNGFMPMNFLQNIPPGGFRPFAVTDDLRIAAKSVEPKRPVVKPAAQPAPTKPPKRSAATAPIEVTIRPGSNADQAWNDYFAGRKEDPRRVRETARRLMHAHKFDEVIAMIRGALRNGQTQPWMYESMAIAMRASGKSNDEVERALLSAIDFMNRPIDVMNVAIYLARIGLDQRALSLFEQASRMAPNEPEPYAHGLAIAQRLKDIEGLKWALCGILSQAWPEEHMDLWKKAHRTAAATLESLRSEGRTEEADAFLKALDAAVVRDVVIEARWSGSADIDLMVEEPTGTICSLRNPRTTAGGAMLTDAFPKTDDKDAAGYEEIYACPKGFSGKYRVLVRRMWGKPAAGKVTVDVYLHTQTDQFEHVRKQVPIGDSDAIVQFDLKGGRRQEPLEEQQVANAAEQQINLRRQLINQQLNSMSDAYALNDLAKSRGQAPDVDVDANLPIIRQPGTGAGFQPVIIVLPQGANLRATAVISADRRYVRFSGLPLFSQISQVQTFNLLTGNTGSSPTPSGPTGSTGSTGFGT